MRINVDDVALRDPAIQKRLPRFTGLGRFDAFGRLVHVWGLAYDMRSAELRIEDVDDTADHEGFAAAMVRAELADAVSHEMVRVRGVAKRIGYLLKQAELGAKGGATRARDGSRGEAGKFSKGTPADTPSEPLDDSKGSPSEPLADVQTKSTPTSCSGSTPDLDLSPAAAGKETFALSGEKPTRTRKKPAARPPAAETPLPDDWKPTPEHLQRAKETGLDLTREVDLFRAKCADKDRKSASWNGAFTQWLIIAIDFRGKRPGAAPINANGSAWVPAHRRIANPEIPK